MYSFLPIVVYFLYGQDCCLGTVSYFCVFNLVSALLTDVLKSQKYSDLTVNLFGELLIVCLQYCTSEKVCSIHKYSNKL